MNIIYIHTHDSGRVLSPYGYNVETPNLYKFCEEATLFRQAYSVAPTCSPSRSGLLTGLYPHSNGMLGLSQRGFKLNNYQEHLVNYLKSHNYHTVLCGIQHEAGSYNNHQKGAEIIGYNENITQDNKDYLEEDLYLWDLENAQAVSHWLEKQHDSKPFFLSYGMFSTHRKYPKQIKEGIDPCYLTPPYPTVDTPETREDFAQYQTSASYFDQAFGIVIESLKKQNLLKNTIVIYTTDHGLAVPFSKGTLYDSGIGVSLAMHVPNSQCPANVIDHLVSHIDIFPTLCDLLNLPKPLSLQGKSFASWFEGSSDSIREEIFAESNFHTSYEPIRCVRTKRYKYIRYEDPSYCFLNLSNIDNSDVKSFYMDQDLRECTKEKEYLFDLLYDSGERKNLIEDSKYKDVLEKMKETLHQHLVQTKDPILQELTDIQSQWKVNTPQCINPSSKEESDYLSLGVNNE